MKKKKIVTVKYLISQVRNRKVCDLCIMDEKPKIIKDGMEVMEIQNENNIIMPDIQEHFRLFNRRWKNRNSAN